MSETPIAQVVIEEFQAGNLKSAEAKRLFTDGKSLSKEEKGIRDELVYLLFDLSGRSWAELKRKTGMHRTTAVRIMANREKSLQDRPEGKAQVFMHQAILEETRFSGRKHLIDLCFDGATKGFTKGIYEMSSMTALQAVKAAAIMTDKGLLLAGQPTNKVGKTDARMMSTEELAEELKSFSKAGHAKDGT